MRAFLLIGIGAFLASAAAAQPQSAAKSAAAATQAAPPANNSFARPVRYAANAGRSSLCTAPRTRFTSA